MKEGPIFASFSAALAPRANSFLLHQTRAAKGRMHRCRRPKVTPGCAVAYANVPALRGEAVLCLLIRGHARARETTRKGGHPGIPSESRSNLTCWLARHPAKTI